MVGFSVSDVDPQPGLGTAFCHLELPESHQQRSALDKESTCITELGAEGDSTMPKTFLKAFNPSNESPSVFS